MQGVYVKVAEQLIKIASIVAGSTARKLVVPVSGYFDESPKHSQQQWEFCPYAP